MAENQNTPPGRHGLRRVIQITSCDGYVVALCDDGSVWEFHFADSSGGSRGSVKRGWLRYPPVPGTEP